TVDAIALQPTRPDDRSRGSGYTRRKRAALLAQVGRYEFDPKGFEVIEGEPIVYWWTKEFLKKYAEAPKLGEVASVHLGISTADNVRCLRRPWEVARPTLERVSTGHFRARFEGWVPTIKGAAGAAWFEPLAQVLSW